MVSKFSKLSVVDKGEKEVEAKAELGDEVEIDESQKDRRGDDEVIDDAGDD